MRASVCSPGAGVPMTSGQLYSAGHTDDLRQALIYIAERYPNAPLLGLGFSLGANVIVRYLAEEGERSRLRAACALGCVRRFQRSFNDANTTELNFFSLFFTLISSALGLAS